MEKQNAPNLRLSPPELRLAQMLKALGNPVRFQIMQYLAEHQVCITGEIVEFTTLAQSTVSQHLKVLRDAGLIEGEIEGPATCYCINEDGVKFLKDQIATWLPNCCVEDENNVISGQGCRKMKMTEESASYFQQAARNWDAIRAGYFGEEVRRAAIAKAYLRPEMAVADIGSGTGFMAAGLAPLVRRVYVVEGSLEMLEVARRNLSSYANIEYHHADGLDLPFPEESLDAVFANMYLHHCPDPLAALREMARVLRPGGRLVITDIDEHPYAWMKEEMADVWQGFQRTQVRAWLRDAGLVNVIVSCTGESCCAESQATADKTPNDREANVSIFVGAGTRHIAVREAVRDSYGALAKDGGSCCSTSASSCCSEGNSGCSCSNESVQILPDYQLEDLSAAPQEAASFSLGCGNPLAMASLRPGEVVLDIGSGGGLDAFLAARQVGESGRVIGVDMTPEMLERARATAQRTGITNVEFRQGYAEALPVEDSSVDVVMSNCVINLAEDKGLVFNEAYRILRSEGRLEVSDIVTSTAMPIEAMEDEQTWAACVSGALPEQEYLDLIAQSGFKEIKVRRRTDAGSIAGVKIYSAAISATKPSGRKSCCES